MPRLSIQTLVPITTTHFARVSWMRCVTSGGPVLALRLLGAFAQRYFAKLVDPRHETYSRGSTVPRVHVPMPLYIDTPCSEPGDARNISPKPGGYHAPADPLTVGPFSNKLVLLDGYHRAALFWKFAPEGSSISAYIPESMHSESRSNPGRPRQLRSDYKDEAA